MKFAVTTLVLTPFVPFRMPPGRRCQGWHVVVAVIVLRIRSTRVVAVVVVVAVVAVVAVVVVVVAVLLHCHTSPVPAAAGRRQPRLRGPLRAGGYY